MSYCNFLHLNSQENNPTESVVANDPTAWFALLKQEGCRGLKAYYHPSEENEQGTPDYKLAGFVGGGGTWLIETVYPSYSDFWAARWVADQPDDPQQNIWSVSYGRTLSNVDTISYSPEVNHISNGLKEILTDIYAFASHHQLNNWSKLFQTALDLLESNQPATGWYENVIIKSSYSQAALQIIFSAMAAHVFGGMGSWNDLSFESEEDRKTYEELSFYLYDYINRALLSGINSDQL